MNPSGGIAVTVLLSSLSATLAGGCASSGAWHGFTSLFGQDRGVPLQEFRAADRVHFPPFVYNFFGGARSFSEDYPTVAEARSGIKLIQVKRLNDLEQPINEANLSWSEDGVYLSFESVSNAQRRIQLKNLMGDYAKELFVIPKGRNDFLDGLVARQIHSYNAGLSWSRDSTRYAFMSNGGVGEYNIYVGAVGAQEQAIAPSSAKDGYASWSPSGDELVFVSARSGNGDLYLVDVGDENVRQLTKGPGVDIFPDWASDGNQVVFSSGDAQNHDLYVLQRTDGRWRAALPLTRWREDDLRPKISPDGRFVAFYATDPRDRPGANRTWNIHVIRLGVDKPYGPEALSDTVVARDVVIDLNTGPCWTPDSKRIFYVKHDPDNFNPIHGYDLFSGREYRFNTGTRMNRDILVSKLGVLSFRAQVGAWDRVFVALTNQGLQLQGRHNDGPVGAIHYLASLRSPR